MNKGLDNCLNTLEDDKVLNYKLKNYNSLDLIDKLQVLREIKGNVIDLVYYNLLRGLKSSFKSDCLRLGKDKVDSLTYNIIVDDFVLSIPLYDLNILRVTYLDKVTPNCMPIDVTPLKEDIYTDLELYENILNNGVKRKDFMKVYGGSKLIGLNMCIFNKRKAIDYLELRISRLKHAIDKHMLDMKIYDDKCLAYNKRIKANKEFLSSISEDITYLESKGYKIDIML